MYQSEQNCFCNLFASFEKKEEKEILKLQEYYYSLFLAFFNISNF